MGIDGSCGTQRGPFLTASLLSAERWANFFAPRCGCTHLLLTVNIAKSGNGKDKNKGNERSAEMNEYLIRDAQIYAAQGLRRADSVSYTHLQCLYFWY